MAEAAACTTVVIKWPHHQCQLPHVATFQALGSGLAAWDMAKWTQVWSQLASLPMTCAGGLALLQGAKAVFLLVAVAVSYMVSLQRTMAATLALHRSCSCHKRGCQPAPAVNLGRQR